MGKVVKKTAAERQRRFMQISIQPTKLSSETLNRIDRVAAILGQGDQSYQEQIATTLVQLASLGYYDGKQAALEALLPMPDLPGEFYGMPVSTGRISGEIN